jgi:phage tail sheath gpL-like
MLLLPGGVTGSSKTPAARSEVLYAQSSSGIGDRQRFLLLVGSKSSASALTDYAIDDINSVDEAIGLVGAGSELAGMIEIAGKRPGLSAKYCAVPENAAGTQATITITIGGSWTKAGSCDVWIDEYLIQVPFLVGGTVTTTAVLAKNDINSRYNIFCVATNSSGVLTLTVNNKGIRGNDHFVYLDKRRLPAGATVVATGGTALTTGAVPFSGGAGTDASILATLLAATVGTKYDYTAWADNSTANVDDIAAQATSKAGAFGAGTENPIFGFADTESASATITDTTINNVFCQGVWMYGRVHPSKLAAAMGALRAVTEAAPVTDLGNPNARYDNVQLLGIPPHFKQEFSPSTTVTDDALNRGLTPIITRGNAACVCRSITTRCKDAATGYPDYSVLDTGAAVTPQRIREEFDNWWLTEHSVANPYCGPDAPSGDLPPPGKSTPKLVITRQTARLKEFEAQNLVSYVDDNPVLAEYNATLKCIVVNIPSRITAQNHSVMSVVRQIAS